MKSVRGARAWWHGRPLRTRVTAGVILVAMVAMLAAGAAAEYFLRTFLVDRLDQQISQSEPSVVNCVNNLSRYCGLPAGAVIGVTSNGQADITLVEPPSAAQLPLDETISAADQTALAQVASVADVSLQYAGDYRVHATTGTNGVTLIVGLPLASIDQTTRRLLILEACAFGSALLLLGVTGAWFVRREMRPLEEVAATARRVAALPLESGTVDLHERVLVDSPDTEVGQVGTAFNAMLGHVESAFEARSASEERLRRFIADASHELRTPLASVRGYAELFRMKGVPEEERTRAVGRIESEAIRMGGLVNDLLLLARLDAADTDAAARPLVEQRVDVALLAADAAADLRAAQPGRPVTLDLPDGDGEPLVVDGDEARLRQVLANLTGNARAHTSPETPVAVRATRDGDVIVLGVEDAGPGIPAELQSEVFNRFTRADSSRTRDTGGSGLGLSIVQALVRAHGGEVKVDSRPGRTMVMVRLPAAPSSGDGDFAPEAAPTEALGLQPQ